MWIDLKDSRTLCTSVVCCIKHTPTPISNESSRSIVSEWLLSCLLCFPKHNWECSAPAEFPAGAVNQIWPSDWRPGCSQMEHRRTKDSFSRGDLPKGITSIAGKQGQALMMLLVNVRELWGHCQWQEGPCGLKIRWLWFQRMSVLRLLVTGFWTVSKNWHLLGTHFVIWKSLPIYFVFLSAPRKSRLRKVGQDLSAHLSEYY